MIHTDFKPENVVIGLRDEEVAEIKRTGQLTTTKMFKDGEYIKKLNMKVAGTLPAQQNPPQAQSSQPAQKDMEADRAALLKMNPNYDSLTTKQKKNLRKKLQKKRKKLDQSTSQVTDMSG